LGEQILRLLQGAGDSGLLMEAHVVRGVTLYFLAEFDAARRELHSVLELYDPAQHRAHAQVFGQEPGMAGHIYLAKTLAVMGQAEQADEHARAAAQIAEETAHFHTSAFCMAYQMVVDWLALRPAAVAKTAARCGALAREQGFPIWEAAAMVLGARAAFELGEPAAEATARLRKGLDLWRATGTVLYAAHWQALLALTLAEQGQHDDAVDLVEAALAEQQQGEERVSLAELHRLRAAVLWLARGDAARAAIEASLREALRIARAQGAGLWEARATADLQRHGWSG
jgi:predicted ATPase